LGVVSGGAEPGWQGRDVRRGVDTVVEARLPDDVTHQPGKFGQDSVVALRGSAVKTLARRVDLEVAVKQEGQARRDLSREEQMERCRLGPVDRGNQGGFNWSSQHLDREVERWAGQRDG